MSGFCEASKEALRQAGARELRPSLVEHTAQLTEMGGGIVSVQAHSDAMNDTLDPFDAYVLTELDGSPLQSKGNEPLRCQTCGLLFSGPRPYSELGAHQAKPCEPPREPKEPHPVRVSLPSSCFLAVQHVVAARAVELTFSEDHIDQTTRSFVVDLSILQRCLHELAFAQASACNLERWYPSVRAITAETTIVPLSDAEWTVLQRLHAAWHIGYGHSVDSVTLSEYAKIEQKLQEAAWGSQAVDAARFFVKTSMRSPKDAAPVQYDANAPAHVRLQQEVEACAVTSAGEALELLVASKRVMVDIATFRKYRCSSELQLNIVLRRWDAEVADNVEWRCFVANGRLTAISQYHCFTTLPELTAATPESLRSMRDALLAFQLAVHTSVVHAVDSASYVLDVAASLDSQSAIRLIEVNPLHSSGSALFSWRRDKELLFHGRADGVPELRIREHAFAATTAVA